MHNGHTKRERERGKNEEWREGFRRPLSVILTLQMQVDGDGDGGGRVPFPSCELRQARHLQDDRNICLGLRCGNFEAPQKSCTCVQIWRPPSDYVTLF